MERAMVSRGRKGERRRDGARLAKIEFARNRDADDGPGDRIFYSRGFGRDSGVGFAGLVSRVSAWCGGWSLGGTIFYGGSGTWWLAAQVGVGGIFQHGRKNHESGIYDSGARGSGTRRNGKKRVCD